MCSLRFENNLLTIEGVRFASISKKTPLWKLSFAFVSLALPLLPETVSTVCTGCTNSTVCSLPAHEGISLQRPPCLQEIVCPICETTPRVCICSLDPMAWGGQDSAWEDPTESSVHDLRPERGDIKGKAGRVGPNNTGGAPSSDRHVTDLQDPARFWQCG